MACICDVTLRDIVHSGSDIGDDWSYRITVDGVTVTLDGEGHGKPRERIGFDPPPRWEIEGTCGEALDVDVRVQAEEQDLFVDDRGERSRTLTVLCPEAGEGPNRFPKQQLTARVEEEPNFLREVHWVAFTFDLETRCAGPD